MYELKKFGKVLTSKSVGTGPSSYEKRIYRTAVSHRLINTAVHVSDGLSVHHQEFKTVHTATGICQTDAAVCTVLNS